MILVLGWFWLETSKTLDNLHENKITINQQIVILHSVTKHISAFDILGTEHRQGTIKTCNYRLVVNTAFGYKTLSAFDILGTEHRQGTIKTCNYRLVVNFKKLGKPQKKNDSLKLGAHTARKTNHWNNFRDRQETFKIHQNSQIWRAVYIKKVTFRAQGSRRYLGVIVTGRCQGQKRVLSS